MGETKLAADLRGGRGSAKRERVGILLTTVFVFFTLSVSERYKLRCKIPSKNVISALPKGSDARK
jgi:hypothetical protein